MRLTLATVVPTKYLVVIEMSQILKNYELHLRRISSVTVLKKRT